MSGTETLEKEMWQLRLSIDRLRLQLEELMDVMFEMAEQKDGGH